MSFTVGDLRRAMEGVGDDVPVVVRAHYDDYDYTDAALAKVRTLEWAPDPEADKGNGPIQRTCLVIE